MRPFFKHFVLSVLLLTAVPSAGQKLMDVINKAEKSVFSIEAYNKFNDITDVASGFFISADGMAITKASIFYDKDSVAIKIRNGKKFSIEKIISVNPYVNLALIKVRQRRQRAFIYFQISRSALIARSDLLIMSHPAGRDKGITVDQIEKVGSIPFVGRFGVMPSFPGYKSYGAPVINNRGLLSGIYCSYDGKSKNVIYSHNMLNDEQWNDINTSKISKNERAILLPYLSMGIVNLISENNVEAAKYFSKYLKVHPDTYEIYCFRALSRFRYNNTVGARDDLEYAGLLKPGGFFAPYIMAVHLLETDREEEAFKYLNLTLKRNPGYIPARVEHARLQWKLNNKIREAFNEFNDIIEEDSLNGRAYYERARLSMQYSSNREMAYEDINRAVYLDPSLPGVFSLRGVMKLSNNDFLGAIDDFTKAIESDPDDVHAYFNRGIAFFNVGMKRNACKDWHKAGDLGNFSAYNYISRYCTK